MRDKDKTPGDDSRPPWSSSTEPSAAGPSSTGPSPTGPGPTEPMLVLGPDVPDVEDTTPEELARRAAEAEREIAERKRQAEAEIAAKQARAERRLREQQLEVDRRERELARKERRLGRASTRGARGRNRGGARTAPAGPKVPLHKQPLHRNWLAALLALGGAGALIGAAVASGVNTDHRAHEAYRDEEFAYAHWQRSALRLDEDVVSHLAGNHVASPGQDPVSVEMIKRAVELTPDGPRYYAEDAVDSMAVILAPSTSPIRALSEWGDIRTRTSIGVPTYQLRDHHDELTDDTWVPYALAGIALLLLIGLAWLAFAGGALVPGGLAVLAALMAGAVIIGAPEPGTIAEADEAHELALDQVSDLVRDVETRLNVAFGLQSGSWFDRPDFWEAEDLGLTPTPELETFHRAQEALGQVVLDGPSREAWSSEEVFSAALPYVQAAQPVLDTELEELEQARLDVDEALTRSSLDGNLTFYGSSLGMLAALGSLGAGAALAARREKADARDKASRPTKDQAR